MVSQIRKRIITSIILVFFILSIIQLFRMQILQHLSYDEKSAENSIKGLKITPPRGVFYDRNFNVLVGNQPSFTIQIVPAEYDRKLNDLLERALELDKGTINKFILENKVYSKYLPVRIKRDVSIDKIGWLEENSEFLPGVNYIVELVRNYPAGVMGAHMFGYTKEISRSQLVKQKGFYSLGDYVGNIGIEKTYEEYVRGNKGIKYVLEDANRRQIGRYNEGNNDITPEEGLALILSIDKNAQLVAEKSFKGKRGALVAIDPKTGEILAFVSSPEYDLGYFSSVTSRDKWMELTQDTSKPLFNRATMSVNPPGSTFKILASIAALEEGIIDTNTLISCPGGFNYGGRFFKCHGAHGPVNVVKAIEKSCNTFFYQLIFRIGLDRWADYAKMFGFGSKTGIDIGEEVAGLVPSSAYYDRVMGKEKWNKGMLVSLGIGQGELSVTPIQLANFTALVANNGKSYKPHFVKGTMHPITKEVKEFKFPEVNLNISERSFNIVKEGMFNVVNGAGGTARSIRLENIQIAGKTGTAQNPHGKDHALFISFAPYNDPKIAVAVIVENSGFGSTHAAPIARDVIKTFLENENNKNYLIESSPKTVSN